MGKILAVLAIGIGFATQGVAAGSTSRCRTIYARGNDTSHSPGSVAVHVCDRLVVDFTIGTQGQVVPDWNVSRQPAKKVLKFTKKAYGPSDSSGDATQEFYFRAVGRGRTRISFKETTPSPGYGVLDTFTMKVKVLPRRTR